MFKTAFVAARDRRRLFVIAGVLIGFGFNKVVDRLGLQAIARMAARNTSFPNVARLSPPQRARRAIEALGPTFIKLGQILASRSDLLTPEWTDELGRLHSQVSPVPWDKIRPQLEEDLGGPPDAIFAEFDHNPIASASIAQVYKARLKTGEEVVVKVLRPGLRKVIEADLRLMSNGARIVEREWPEIARYKPQEQMRHLAAGINGELDLINEARNCEMLAAIFADREDIVFPRIHWEHTTERVLVQEFLHGIPLTDHARLDAGHYDKPLLAQKGTDAFLQMALIEGVFHADPHPGNLLAMTGNRVGFLDFGMIGRLSQKRRDQLLMMIGAMLGQNADGLMAVLIDWSGSSAPDLAKLDAAAHGFVQRHSGVNLNLALVLTDFMTMARENDLSMPTDLAILFKSLVSADGVMRQLDPEFDLFTAAGPTVQQNMKARFSFDGFKKRLAGMGAGLFSAVSDLPALVHLLLVRLKQGKMTVEIEIKGLDQLIHGIELAATRLAIALVVAAFTLTIAPRLLALGEGVFVSATVVVALIGIGWMLLLRRKRSTPR
jgi:ubiquinone biosynthesis protein